MFDSSIMAKSPLNIEEIQRIDSSGLSSTVRHKIRLLAHCLSCFKQISSRTSAGDFPSSQECLNWLIDQPALRNDREFVFILLEQLNGAERHLKQLAIKCKTSPLDLTLNDLINEGLKGSKL